MRTGGRVLIRAPDWGGATRVIDCAVLAVTDRATTSQRGWFSPRPVMSRLTTDFGPVGPVEALDAQGQDLVRPSASPGYPRK
jgi:hypothetical protein